MRGFISRSLIGYYLLIILALALVSLTLAREMTDLFILALVFGLVFFIITIIFIYMTRMYIKPMEELSDTLEQLLKGNLQEFDQKTLPGPLGEIHQQVNMLATNIHHIIREQGIQSRQLSTIIENTESGLLLLDEEGFILYTNRKFTEIIGETQALYQGKRYYEALQNERIPEIIRQSYFEGEIIKGQAIIRKKHLDIVSVPIFSDKEILKGIVLALYDVTKFKQLDIMRKDFVANVSHELKTPITSIKGFAETLLTIAPEDQEAREDFLKIVLSESNRMKQLIDQLLLLSKIEQEAEHLQITNIILEDLIKEIEPLFQSLAKEKNLHLDIRLEEGLELRADRQGLSQIIVNLMMNAIIYTGEGGRVELNCREEGNYIKFLIRDTGKGIPAEEIPRIFERFYRIGEDRGRETGGTGLGLSIVKHIVSAHKGTVTVESVVNKGSLFTLYLPKEI